MEDIISNIKDNSLFYNIKDEELKELLGSSNYYIEKYNKGEIIAQEDDNCTSIGLVLEGTINIETIYPSGKGIVMKKLLPGDVFGEALIFSKETTYPATVIANSNCTIGYLNKKEVIKLLSLNSIIFENFMMLLSDKVLTLKNKIKSISLKNVRQKVVNYILQEYISQKDFKILLNLSKEEIAGIIGIPRPSLSRELIKLREEKLIEFDRNTINILDIDRLEDILFE
ncbi:MAG: Crp/Fnr family transcriptional regulator [Clostridium sp.]|nr:Crp/Fnr family transcriptional regulator [Clostridium sp.]